MRISAINLAIVPIVVSQVCEFQLRFGTITLSIEELFVVVAAGMLLAYGQGLRTHWVLVGFASVEAASYTLYDLSQGNFGGLLRPLISVTVLLIIYNSIFEAARKNFGSTLDRFARVWLIMAGASAAVVLLQYLGVLAEAALVKGEIKVFSRPTGLHNDPNFAAATFLVAIIFATRLKRGRYSVSGAFLFAILLTESRMGLLIGLLAILLHFALFLRLQTAKDYMRLSLASSTSAFLVLALLLPNFSGVTSSVSVLSRMNDALQQVTAISLSDLERTRGYQSSSALERLMLAYGGVRVWQKNPFFGVGTQRVSEELHHVIGVRKATHNGYIDRMVVGGLGGVAYCLFIAFVLLILISHLSRSSAFRFLFIWMSCIALGMFFLSLSFWPLMCFVAAAFAAQRNHFTPDSEKDSSPPFAISPLRHGATH